MNNDDEQTVNHEALRQQVERLLAGGVHGMFWATARLTPSFKEKEEILATVIDQVKGRVPVYAGTGRITTAETIRMSKRRRGDGRRCTVHHHPQLRAGFPERAVRPLCGRGKAGRHPHHPLQHPGPHRQQALPETVQALCRAWTSSSAQRIPAATSRT